MRTFNLRLFLWLVGIFAVSLVAIYFVHRFQVRRNAGVYQDLAEKADEECRSLAKKLTDLTPEEIQRDPVTQETRAQLAKSAEDAIKHYRRFLALRPDEDDVRVKYGEFLRDTGDVGRAFLQFEQVLRSAIHPKPPRTELRIRQVDLALAMRRYTDAADHLTGFLIKADPPAEELAEQAKLNEKLAICEIGMGKFELAEASLQRAIKQAPDLVSAYFQLARLQRSELRQPKVAIETIDKMVELNANQCQAYVARARFTLTGSAQQTSDDGFDPLDAATKDANAALALASTDADALSIAAECARRARDFVKAEELINRGINSSPEKATFYLQFANLALTTDLQVARKEAATQQVENKTDPQEAEKTGRQDEKPRTGREIAIEKLREGLQSVRNPNERFPLKWQLAYLLMDRFTRDEDAAKARVLLAELKREQPERANVKYLDARQLALDGKWQEARKILETCISDIGSQSELFANANLLLGACYQQLGEEDLRLETNRRALDLDRTSVTSRIQYAEALLAVGRLREALQEYREAKQMDEAQPDVSLRIMQTEELVRFAQVLLIYNLALNNESRNWPEVEDLLERLAEKSSDEPRIPLLLAQIANAKKDLAEATKRLQEAVQSERFEKHLMLWRALVSALGTAGKHDDANAILAEIKSRFGDTVDVRLTEADALFRARNVDDVGDTGKELIESLLGLEDSTDTFPGADRERLYWGLSRYLLLAGDLSASIRLGRQALALNEGDLQRRLTLLEVALRAKDTETSRTLAAEIEQIEVGGPVTLVGQAMDILTQYARHQPEPKPGTAGSDESPQVDAVTKAEQAERLSSAKSKLLLAQKLRSSWQRVPLLLAGVEQAEGNQRAATDYYMQAINLGARGTNVIRNLVKALYLEGEFAEADKVIRLLDEQQAPISPDVDRLASEISWELDDYDRALERAKKAAQDSDDYENQWWLGQLLWSRYAPALLGDADAETKRAALAAVHEAEMNFLAAKKQRPSAPEPRISLVKLLAATHRPEEAIQEILLAEQDVKEDLKLGVIVSMFDDVKLFDQADREVAAALAKMPTDIKKATPEDIGVLKLAANHYVRSGNFAAADRILKQIPGGEDNSRTGDTKEIRRRLALNLAAQRGYPNKQKALNLLNINLMPGDFSPDKDDLLARARILASLPFRREAIADFEQLAKLGHVLAVADQFTLAQLYWNDGKWPQCDEQMRSVLAADEKDVKPESRAMYVRFYVNALLNRGEVNEARLWAGSLTKLEPHVIRTALLQARALVAGEYPKSDEALRAVQQAVNDPAVDITDPQGRITAADSKLQKMIPAAFELENGLDHLKKLNKNDLAEPFQATIQQYYQQVSGDDPGLKLMQVPYLTRQGMAKQALELTRTYWESTPPNLLYKAGSSLLQSTDLEPDEVSEVESILLRTVSKSKDGAELPILAVLAGHYVRNERYDEAANMYRDILKLNQTDIVALNNLALIMASRQDRSNDALKEKQRQAVVESALELTNVAFQLVGPVTTVVDSQTMIHLAMKNRVNDKKALDNAQTVIQQKPERIDIENDTEVANRWGGYYFHLALAYQANNDKESARVAMKNAEDLGFGLDDVFPLEVPAYQKLTSYLAP